MKKNLLKCPVCGGKLRVAEYRCDSCGTIIRGRFDICEFCALSEEELKFLKSFILSYGNISVVAKKYNISHPTAKLRLKAIIKKLGWEEEDSGISARKIIEMIENGEISVEEALKILKEGQDG